MSSHRNGRLAEDEFAFRYLFPENAREQFWPLDRIEQQFHFSSRCDDLRTTATDDLEHCFRACVVGDTATGTVRERLLCVLFATHSPSTVTPYNSYSLHASYPSPRAYYPLAFVLACHASSTVYWIDTRDAKLRLAPNKISLLDAEASPGSEFSLWIYVNFGIYNPLYNLFRKSLFALEVGHFLGELISLGIKCGLQLQPKIDERGIRVEARESHRSTVPMALRHHRAFARARNSGFARTGLFPTTRHLDAGDIDRLIGVIREAIDAAQDYFPVTRRFSILAQLCLRSGDSVAAGVYAIEGTSLRTIDATDPVDTCGRLYNYQNFGFTTVPGLVFLSVASASFAAEDSAFLELNVALGYVSQRMIRHLVDKGLFGRPFRSYDQHGVDQLLHNDTTGRKAYYGLLIGKNRCQLPLGVMR